ncbi:MAG: Nucleoside diphosphate kinase [uncultured Thermomicrobiales bacterium]|uniref:Nucleoside diphosphate kinase n=1 Tax=uncultured Thermomicrobiales bacterium TaxID=1645740 RepID=A0A6J4V2W1_9BACT|nr:MAG: Nucleoside diphosphate kinase [uncultured Thermomicrobiales bacterium]
MADNQRSLVIIKPDAVQRGLTGEILARYERRGLRIVALKLEVVSRETAERHYAEHEGKPFFAGLVDYITSSPSVVLILEGPDAIGVVRTMNGATRPAEAVPGTIRGDFGLTVGRNLVHASDSVESAAREVGIFFDADAALVYQRAIDPWIVEA